ncbi:MAG: lytic transglycosylase domain-containing protein [Gammaproteobacteria bacterium]|nr:lytic transglycosylase domain-containing protein [Gammaproteobacteria bacterium]
MYRTIKYSICFALLALSSAIHAVSQTESNQQLKQRLTQALAEHEGFSDRFDAEVWLTDMTARFKGNRLKEEERLQLLKQVHLEATRAELAPELVLALIEVESNFDQFAISSAGAQGLMQIMPFWLKEIGRTGDNLFNIRTNLRMGCTILRHYLDIEKGNITRALARYNGSLGSYRYPNKVFTKLRNRWN